MLRCELKASLEARTPWCVLRGSALTGFAPQHEESGNRSCWRLQFRRVPSANRTLGTSKVMPSKLVILLLTSAMVSAPARAEPQRSAAELMDAVMWNREPIGGPFALVDH